MFELSPRVTSIAVITTAGTIMVGIIVAAWWQKRKNRIPDKWRHVGELVELSLYPMKSGNAFNVPEAECTIMGCRADYPFPLRDRFFTVVSEKGTTKTARQHPPMLLIKAIKSDEDSITFHAPGMDELTVMKPKGRQQKVIGFTMWQGEYVECVDCGDKVADWIHSYLGLKEDNKIRVGYFLEYLNRRNLFSKAWSAFKKLYPKMKSTDGGVFSDMASFMLINEASVTDLRNRVGNGHAVNPSWFRPNFVVRGPQPYAEDKWNYIKIGDSAVFQYFKPCTRCLMTTLDPVTASKDSNSEPLKTLQTYRMLRDPKYQDLENSPVMGSYLGLRRPGSVKIGDPVYISEV